MPGVLLLYLLLCGAGGLNLARAYDAFWSLYLLAYKAFWIKFAECMKDVEFRFVDLNPIF